MKAQLIQGTWAWGHHAEQQWWECGSPFCAFLKTWDVSVIGGDRPFVWSTAVDGLGFLHRTAKRHIQWESAGYNLDAYLRPALLEKYDDYVPLEQRNLIGHSHALQVIAYACAGGLKVNRLITIGSPVRDDMRAVYQAARPNIGKWLHVHSDGSDKMQWFGELFDGHLGIVREAPLADKNVLVGKVSHSKLLNDPAAFPLWQSKGLLAFLHGVTQ